LVEPIVEADPVADADGERVRGALGPVLPGQLEPGDDQQSVEPPGPLGLGF
jgi:hypothetical protein